MQCQFVIEKDFPKNKDSLLVSYFISYHNWIIHGNNKLSKDKMLTWTTTNPVIYNKRKHSEYNEDDVFKFENGIGYVNTYYRPPYPIEEKNNSGFVWLPYSTLHGAYHATFKTEEELSKKRNLPIKAIINTLMDVHGPSVEIKSAASGIRYDILLNNKKILGSCTFSYNNRLAVVWSLQNEYTEQDDITLRNLMNAKKDDSHWHKSHGNIEGITGAKIDPYILLQNMQKER